MPEFSELPSSLSSVVDKAFDKSIVKNVSDVREWKPIRDETLKNQPNLTPRELARFKFSLCHTGSYLTPTSLGRPALHSWIDLKAKKMFPHLNALEILSVLSAFATNSPPDLYEELLTLLYKEILEVNDLNTLAMSIYTVSHYYNYTTKYYPCYKNPKHSELSAKFFQIVTPVVIEKITEFTDDQFATICAGIGRNSVNPLQIDSIYPLVDALQAEVLARRGKRMSLENLVDVAAGFFNNNLGTEELAKLVMGKVMEKKKDLSYFTGVDFVLSVSEREICNKELVKIVNGLVKNDLATEDYMKISKYIFNTECKDEEVITSFFKSVENLPKFPEKNYQELKKLQFYLEKNLNHLVPESFLEKVEHSGYAFDAKQYLRNCLETSTKPYKEFSDWLDYLKLSFIGPYIYKNHDLVDWAWMPQKVAIMLAQPKFHLIGKWEEDNRIIKEPMRKYKVSNGFELKCKWLELLGLKVIRMNYQDIAENAVSRKDRDAKMLAFLAPLDIKPQ